MDETGAYYTEWSKPERKTPIQYTNAYIWNLERWYGKDNPICKIPKETQMYRTVFWTLWEKASVGWFERIALKHVYYHMWNRLPVQVRCMRQDAQVGALRWPRGMGWGGRWEGGSGWGTHVHPWLIHVNVWQKPPQYCKVISFQLKKKLGLKWFITYIEHLNLTLEMPLWIF